MRKLTFLGTITRIALAIFIGFAALPFAPATSCSGSNCKSDCPMHEAKVETKSCCAEKSKPVVCICSSEQKLIAVATIPDSQSFEIQLIATISTKQIGAKKPIQSQSNKLGPTHNHDPPCAIHVEIDSPRGPPAMA